MSFGGFVFNMVWHLQLRPRSQDNLGCLMELTIDEALKKDAEANKPRHSRANILDSLKLDQAFRLAQRNAKDGLVAEASGICQDILAKFPMNQKSKDLLKTLSSGNLSKKPITLDPSQDQLQAIMNFYGQGRLQEALAQSKKLLEQFPNSATLYNIQGAANAGLKQFDDAIDSYNQAIKIKPDYAQAYCNMGNALQDVEKLGAAIESYRKAIKIKPEYYGAYNNMATALRGKGDLEAAITNYKRAIKIKPNYFQAYNNMAIALQQDCDLRAAIESYKQALKINPEYQLARASKLHQQAQICDWDKISEDQELIPLLGTSTQFVDPFPVMSLEDAPARHLMRAQVYSKAKYKQKPLPLNARPTQKPERLRIGYFSADFREHPVSFLLARTLELHNRDKFEIHAYSYGPNKPSPIRERLITAVDSFNDIKTWHDLEIVEKVRDDKIDIAIDLTGYTLLNRAGLFAHRLAPIQINYLGFEATIGADFMDYIVSDHTCIPKDSQKHYNEKVLYLPNAYMPTDNLREISGRAMSRTEFGLPEDGFVFCCFNANYKITPTEFDIWARILLQVPNSVLWLRKPNKWAESNLIKEAAKRGVDAKRIIFADKVNISDHLARHKLADLFLDTFNMNAHATAIDALWAGLPIVSKLGEGFCARAGVSYLRALDLPELVAESESDYEALILDLALNPDRLNAIRDKLNRNRLTAPLFNTECYVRDFEAGLEKAYNLYFEGKEPEHISAEKSKVTT